MASSTRSRTRREPAQDSAMYFLVQFTDNQRRIAKDHHLRNTASGKLLALWPPTRKWYNAEVLGQGSKMEMEKLLQSTDDSSRLQKASEEPSGSSILETAEPNSSILIPATSNEVSQSATQGEAAESAKNGSTLTKSDSEESSDTSETGRTLISLPIGDPSGSFIPETAEPSSSISIPATSNEKSESATQGEAAESAENGSSLTNLDSEDPSDTSENGRTVHSLPFGDPSGSSILETAKPNSCISIPATSNENSGSATQGEAVESAKNGSSLTNLASEEPSDTSENGRTLISLPFGDHSGLFISESVEPNSSISIPTTSNEKSESATQGEDVESSENGSTITNSDSEEPLETSENGRTLISLPIGDPSSSAATLTALPELSAAIPTNNKEVKNSVELEEDAEISDNGRTLTMQGSKDPRASSTLKTVEPESAAVNPSTSKELSDPVDSVDLNQNTETLVENTLTSWNSGDTSASLTLVTAQHGLLGPTPAISNEESESAYQEQATEFSVNVGQLPTQAILLTEEDIVFNQKATEDTSVSKALQHLTATANPETYQDLNPELLGNFTPENEIYAFNDTESIDPLPRFRSRHTKPIYNHQSSDEELFSDDDMESEYTPETRKSDTEETDLESENDSQPKRVIEKIKETEKDDVSLKSQALLSSVTSKETPEVPQTSAPTVPTCCKSILSLARKTTKQSGARVWDKKYPCKFCGKLFAKLPRHLEHTHKDEIEVASYSALPKSSKERKKKIEMLRSAGEQIHNFKLYGSTDRKGEVLLKRRVGSTSTDTAESYLPCENCGRMIRHTYLARHVRSTCPARQSTDKSQSTSPNLRGLQSRCALMLPHAPEVPEDFKRDILQKMNYDEVFNTITNDKLILEFGRKRYEQLRKSPNRFRFVKDRMRELGRLLLEAKKLSDRVTCLCDLINPTMFKIIKEATMIVAGFDKKTGTYETPTLVLKIGQSLKKCAAKYKGMCMDDEVLFNNVERINMFVGRMDDEWSGEMATHAHSTLHERRWNAPQRIPLAEDVRRLHIHLEKSEICAKENVYLDPSPENYRQFCEIVLCRVLLLNRRRVGETQFVKLADYEKSKSSQQAHDSDLLQGLSDIERVLVKTLHRFETRGKKGRVVPVILTEALRESLDLLVKLRETVNVPSDNPFLFPSLTLSEGHYRADVILRKHALACGASAPNSLTGTKLRKHVGTMTQLLNLKEHELDAVATYMGHDIRVHRQYYRLPSDTMQLAKVSKLLLAMEGGDINRLKGSNLDDIKVDDLIAEKEIEVSEDSDDERTSEEKPKKDEKKRHSVKNLPKQSNKRMRLSPEDSSSIKGYFKKHIQDKRLPGKEEISKFQEKYPNMKSILWSRIKYHVYNAYASQNRKK